MSVEPGWYPDPAEPSTQRYWDGEGWIGAPLPVDATPPPGPPPAEPEPAPPAPPAPVVPTGPAGATGAEPTQGPGAVAPTPAGPGHPPAPAGPAAPPGAAGPTGFMLAPLGARLVARLIDIGIVFALNIVVNGWFVWQWVQEVSPLFAEAWRRSAAGDTSTEGLPQPDPRAGNLVLVILLITAALWFAYEVPAVANNGQTFGKRIMGIRVITLTGEQQIGFGRSLRRWNTLGLPVFLWYCCGLGFVLQLIDCAMPLFDRPLRQALHDKRAHTVVVQAAAQPPPTAESPTDDNTDTPGGSA
ncbi:MAG TPA: RDD family protein [Micromonospora sp.]|nr:RDD family protein [Micromonospora sp.]